MANFFVIYERQENEGKEVAGQTLGLTKVLPAKVRTSETAGRWSGSPELAKIVLVEAATALEARNNVAAMFPGSATTAMVSVAEGSFVES